MMGSCFHRVTFASVSQMIRAKEISGLRLAEEYHAFACRSIVSYQFGKATARAGIVRRPHDEGNGVGRAPGQRRAVNTISGDGIAVVSCIVHRDVGRRGVQISL